VLVRKYYPTRIKTGVKLLMTLALQRKWMRRVIQIALAIASNDEVRR
jgi:hypothetical protein